MQGSTDDRFSEVGNRTEAAPRLRLVATVDGRPRAVDEDDWFDPDGWMQEMRKHPDRPVTPRGRPAPAVVPWFPPAPERPFPERVRLAWALLRGGTA